VPRPPGREHAAAGAFQPFCGPGVAVGPRHRSPSLPLGPRRLPLSRRARTAAAGAHRTALPR
jgi:hypothetical protein